MKKAFCFALIFTITTAGASVWQQHTAERQAHTRELLTPLRPYQSTRWSDVYINAKKANPSFLAFKQADGGIVYTRSARLRVTNFGQLQSLDGLDLLPAVGGLPVGAIDLAITAGGKLRYYNPAELGMATAGQIFTYKFPQPENLAPLGNDLWQATSAAGKPVPGIPAQEGFAEVWAGWLGAQVVR